MEFPPKDLAADQCPYDFIPSNSTVKEVSDEYILPLFKISYMWYTLVGAIFTMLISLLSSLVFGLNDPSSISKELLTPCLRNQFIKEEKERTIKTIKDTEL